MFYALEHDFTCLLVNAAHIKQAPGRKTDIQDCLWIAQLLEHGLLGGQLRAAGTDPGLRHLTEPVLFRPCPISRAAPLPVASRERPIEQSEDGAHGLLDAPIRVQHQAEVAIEFAAS